MSINESLASTETINGFRYYNIDKYKKYPSVTTIIGFGSDNSWLEEWQDRIGVENAKKITEFSANRGSVMHQLCEYFLESVKLTKRERLIDAQERIINFIKTEGFTEDEENVGRKLFFNFYNNGFFDRIKRIVKIEATLYSNKMGGYAGRTDVIFEDFDDNLIILDFKSSKKPKDENQILNYYRQIAAYFIAYWEMYNVQPNGGEIWISNESDSYPQCINLTRSDIYVHAKEFLKLVKDFHIHNKIEPNI